MKCVEILLICGVLLLGTAIWPGSVRGAEAESASFAAVLLEEGDYFRCITEYRREIFLSPEDPGNSLRWYRIGKAYLLAGRYNEALKVFGDTKLYLGDEMRWKDRFLYRKGLTFLIAGTQKLARQEFERLGRTDTFLTAVGEDRLELALAATWFEERNWKKTRKVLDGFEERHKDATKNAVAVLLRQRTYELEEMPRKQPWLAGLMSAIVPGTGQFYEERWGDGVQSLLITGVFGAATAASGYAEYHYGYSNWVIPSVMGVGFLVFYVANIYGAVNGARMVNELRQYDMIGDTREQYMGALYDAD